MSMETVLQRRLGALPPAGVSWHAVVNGPPRPPEPMRVLKTTETNWAVAPIVAAAEAFLGTYRGTPECTRVWHAAVHVTQCRDNPMRASVWFFGAEFVG